MEFIEKYDGDNLILFEVYQNKLDERKKLTKSLKKNAQLKKVEQMSEEEIKNGFKINYTKIIKILNKML